VSVSCVSVSVRLCLCVCYYIYIYIYTYVNIYIYIYIYMYICIYVCILGGRIREEERDLGDTSSSVTRNGLRNGHGKYSDISRYPDVRSDIFTKSNLNPKT
jgi:hypothetical protein